MTELQELFEQAQQTATSIFEKDGDLHPMWHLQTAGGENLLVSTPWGDDDEKKYTIEMLKILFAERNVVRFVFMTEVWFKAVPLDQNVREVQLPISNHVDRKEALWLLGVDRNTAEEITLTREINRESGKPMLMEAEKIMNPDMRGKLSNLFGLNRTKQ